VVKNPQNFRQAAQNVVAQHPAAKLALMSFRFITISPSQVLEDGARKTKTRWPFRTR
jgi:hypothetical protein